MNSSPAPARKPNRLATQSSPYLLQHAFNPVDWFPWGEEAFAEARRRDVPILLSVGYSTCYWCHVMERECFEDEAIGALMSERFVCIKLDREERPDVDEVYMTATQMLTGHGGWPMNVFLEPQSLRPFWAGTYFPPEPRMNLPSWPRVLEQMSELWRTKRGAVEQQSAAVADAVGEALGEAPDPVDVGEAQVTEALTRVLRMFDRVNGGFGTAPKFPQPVFLEYLLDVRAVAGDDSTLDAVDEAIRRTLNKMMCGGILDHVGGGFHRYSVDAAWTVPHFEKMLYDNAQLLAVYARAARLYGDEEYARVAQRTAEYVLGEMTHASGAFFSAQDAEVDGREGLNYLWTPEQVRAALPAEDAELAIKVYGVDLGPNFTDPHHPDHSGANVLRLADRVDRLAQKLDMPGPALVSRLERINIALHAERAKRTQPRLDDKVLASWNGMMITGLARAGRELGEQRFVEAAARAAAAVQNLLGSGDGTLRRSWRDGVNGPAAVLEDYAWVVAGLAELATALKGTDEGRAEGFLSDAGRLAATARRQFSEESGRWFDTRAGQADLFVRTAASSDGALPSALSTMLHGLLELLALTKRQEYGDQSGGLLAAMSGAIAASPVGTINATRALFRVLTDEPLRPAAPRPTGKSAPVVGDDEQEPFLPVEVYADVERLTVREGEPAVLHLAMKIGNGYHVIAADSKVDGHEAVPGLVALRAGVHGGQGVRVFADYPRGAAYGPEGSRVMVHHGTVEFRVIVEREGAWKGRPVLTLTYQACTETECLDARTVELDVALDPG